MKIDNEYYAHLVYEVQVVVNCDEEKARRIVAIVASLGGDPADFIQRLPGISGNGAPDTDALLATLEELRIRHDVKPCSVCFPAGYRNRAERRKKGVDR